MVATTGKRPETVPTVPAVPSGPRPYLQPGTRHYQLARAIYDGEPLADVCERIGMKVDTAYSVMCRLRARASAYAGRKVSETYALRLVFDPGLSELTDDELERFAAGKTTGSRF